MPPYVYASDKDRLLQSGEMYTYCCSGLHYCGTFASYIEYLSSASWASTQVGCRGASADNTLLPCAQLDGVPTKSSCANAARPHVQHYVRAKREPRSNHCDARLAESPLKTQILRKSSQGTLESEQQAWILTQELDMTSNLLREGRGGRRWGEASESPSASSLSSPTASNFARPWSAWPGLNETSPTTEALFATYPDYGGVGGLSYCEGKSGGYPAPWEFSRGAARRLGAV
ncbi:hypothetical protein F4778DRAFT_780027 [Xylariomycetidae sp. FL2044]|nr:hypothetical protein F4778DRAFT_780027 [Xylariomycetidae sp. FL2044]